MSHEEAVVIGAGPIGIEMGANLKANGIRYRHLEAGQIGSSIMWWPPSTLFFSSPEWVAIAGIPIHTSAQEIITGEQYLAYLRLVVELLDLQVETYRRVTRIEKPAGKDLPGGGRYLLTVEDRCGTEYIYTDRIILATGDMSSPRMLGIEGEDLPHVSHYFTDPHRFFQKELLIVGGRNSALEAALRCWRTGARVSLSYRKPRIPSDRVISRLLLEVELLVQRGQITFYPETVPVRITNTEVELAPAGGAGGGSLRIPSDFVLLCTGFVPDQSLFDQLEIERAGVELRPVVNPDTQETSRDGVYAAGTAAAGDQQTYRTFIATSHAHVERIIRHIKPNAEVKLGNLSTRNYPLNSMDIE
ncbi:MAG: NAD(P)-binding domain-containing protein [Spirochaeta sp.]